MGFLSEKDKRRMREVSEKLAAGINPYTPQTPEDRNKRNADAGGLDRDRKVRVLERPHQNVVDPKTRAILRAPNHPEGKVRMPDPPPGQVRCSYCAKCVPDDHRVTRGYGPMQTSGNRRELAFDPVTHFCIGMQEIPAKVFRTKVVACADCCLNVKPYITKKGEMISPGQKWRETE